MSLPGTYLPVGGMAGFEGGTDVRALTSRILDERITQIGCRVVHEFWKARDCTGAPLTDGCGVGADRLGRGGLSLAG